MLDPIASKSSFLSMYMTNHPDTLVAYIKHFGKVPGNVSFAEMKSIDCNGMDLSYLRKSGGIGFVHIEFDPPLAGYEEVKPRLLAMKADAQEALGMLKFPEITSFRLPTGAVLMPIYLLVAAYISWAPPQGTALPFMPADIANMVFMPARAFVSTIGFQPHMRTILQITAFLHGLESIYMWHLCRRCVKGSFLMAAFVSSTFFFGFPTLADLKKSVREKRIESVMKVE